MDQVSKIWVKSNYRLGENILDWGVVRFDFVENPGMAFGLSFGGLASKYVLGVFRLFAIFFIGKYLLKIISTNAHRLFIVLVSLIFAGAIGNLIDNMFYGFVFDLGTHWDSNIEYWVGYSGIASFGGQYCGFLEGCVVDMIHLTFFWPNWVPFGWGGGEVFPPVFNVADACISSSVFILVVFYKKLVRKEDIEFSFFKSSS